VEVYDFYSTIIIIMVIKSRQVRWVWFVACMKQKRNAQCFGGGT